MSARHLAASLAAAFAAVAAAVATGSLAKTDRALIGRWADVDAHLLLRCFAPLSSCGLLVLLCALYPPGSRLRLGASAAGGLVALTAVELACKLWWPQPAGMLPHHAGVIAVDYAFPSGHALRAAFLAVLCAALLPPLWRVLPAAVAVAVATLMAATGHHFPSETAAGALLGAAGGVGVLLAAGRPDLGARQR